MSFKSLKLLPGLNSSLTPTENEMGWTAGPDPTKPGFPLSNLIRFPVFSKGQPEVVGGWTALAGIGGTAIRGLHAWETLPSTITAGMATPLLAIGSTFGTLGLLFIYDYSATPPHLLTFSSPASVMTPGIWFLDNFGQDLLAVLRTGQTPVGSPIYLWVPAPGFTGFAMPLTGGPPAANGVIVNSVSQQAIAWGVPVPDPATSTWGTVQDPMLIAWTDNSDITDWFASPTNAAGSFRLSQGSQIFQIIAAQGQMLVHTDSALYAMQFIGSPFIYGFQQLGTNCGSIAPKAATTIGGQDYWWGSNGQFYTYNGVVVPIPCPIRSLCLDTVLPNTPNAQKITASTNSRYSEVRWDFPSTGAADCDTYVSYNTLIGDPMLAWSYGTTLPGSDVLVGRTAMTDFVPTLGFPVGGDSTGIIWLQETDNAVRAQDGTVFAPLPWMLTSGYTDIAEGEEFVFVDSIYPDAVQTGGNVGIRTLTQAYPYATTTVAPPVASPPFIFAPGTTLEIPVRQRGRQLALQFSNAFNKAPLFWRLGKVRLRVATDGRR